MSHIFLLNGHPDGSPERFCAALTSAYAEGARRAGHDVRRLDLGAMNFPLIRTAEQSNKGEVAPDARRVQEALVWADHVVVVFPLWLDDQPAYLRALFEQVFRYGFVHENFDNTKKRLKGKTVHTIVTMGVSEEEYREQSCAYGLKMLETGLWKYAGMEPIQSTLIGSIHSIDEAARKAWLQKIQDAGAAAR